MGNLPYLVLESKDRLRRHRINAHLGANTVRAKVFLQAHGFKPPAFLDERGHKAQTLASLCAGELAIVMFASAQTHARRGLHHSFTTNRTI